MRLSFYLVFLACTLAMACTPTSEKGEEETLTYTLIVQAIDASKTSRLQFQDAFAKAIDSFFSQGVQEVHTNELRALLDVAISENSKAIGIVSASEEVDEDLRYRKKTLDMFYFLDREYRGLYRNLITAIENGYRTPEIFKLKPSTDSFKILATEVVVTGKVYARKHDIQLHKVQQ